MARLILALFFALCVAIFAVINVSPTPIHYLFGVATVPLVLIILGSALVGGLIAALIGAVSHLRWRRDRRQMLQYISHLESQIPAESDDTDFDEAVHEAQVDEEQETSLRVKGEDVETHSNEKDGVE